MLLAALSDEAIFEVGLSTPRGVILLAIDPNQLIKQGVASISTASINSQSAGLGTAPFCVSGRSCSMYAAAQALLSALDLVLRWLVLRICEGHMQCLLKVLELTRALLDALYDHVRSNSALSPPFSCRVRPKDDFCVKAL